MHVDKKPEIGAASQQTGAESPERTSVSATSTGSSETAMSGGGTSCQPASPNTGTASLTDEQAEKAEKISKNEVAIPEDPDRPKLSGYIVVKKLGEGTYGKVWLVRKNVGKEGMEVAIKTFTRRLDRDLEGLQEVAKLATLHNLRGVVQLLDVHPEVTPPCYVMVYIKEGSLDKQLGDGKTLSPDKALEWFRQITESLAFVHNKGVIHCDLKPANILLSDDGPLIGDFGSARFSGESEPTLGTFFYMAPEQAERNSAPDARWDVYSLGAIFYAMLTGKGPYQEGSLEIHLNDTQSADERLRIYREHIQQSPRPTNHRKCEIDRDLAEIIDRCLEVNPEKRLPNPAAILSKLRERERKRRQRPLLVFGLLVPLVLLFAVGVLAVWNVSSMRRKAEANLANQLLQSSRYSARIAASVIDEKLSTIKETVKENAKSPRLREAVLAASTKDNEEKMLELLRQFANEIPAYCKADRWAIFDKNGVMLTNLAKSGEDVEMKPIRENWGKNLSWRDYWHGQGDRYDLFKREIKDPNKRLLDMIDKTHVCDPFCTTSDNPKPVKGFIVSTPIYLGESKEKIGLLVALFSQDTVTGWLVRASNPLPHGFPVLLNNRGHCLLHHEEKAKIDPQELELPPVWAKEGDSHLFAKAVWGKELEGTSTEDGYIDPIDGRTYLAGYAKGEKNGWVVVVQHHREDAITPVTLMKDRLREVGAGLLAVVVCLLALTWIWLYLLLRRQSKAAYG